MSAAASVSTHRNFGVVMVSQEWELPRSTFYRQRQRAAAPARKPPTKRGPRQGLTDEMLLTHIRADLASTSFVGEGHRKVWARLRFAGMRTSKLRVLRADARAWSACTPAQQTGSGTAATRRCHCDRGTGRHVGHGRHCHHDA